jgi:cytosine/adenosine deaminase-related metal-dependent hydrolase
VAVGDDRIIDVGPMPACPYTEAERVIDASGKAVLPGFINAHTHAIHILMRGGLSDDRSLYDWLFNVVLPGLAVYRDDDVAVAAEHYCRDAIRAGITTFVDNVEFPVDRFAAAADAAIDVYARIGLRVIYARMFYDHTPSEFSALIDAVEAKEPGVRHDPGGFESTESALVAIEAMIQKHHGAGGGRIHHVVFNASSPVSAKRCRTFYFVCRNFDHHLKESDVLDWEAKIMAQDQRIIESARPEELPLNLHDELHVRADRVTTAYRRALAELGLGHDLTA